MSNEVAISGAEVLRRVLRQGRGWSLWTKGLGDRQGSRALIKLCYEATLKTLTFGLLEDPGTGQRLASRCRPDNAVDLHQEDEGRLRPMSPAWGHCPDGGDEFWTGSELPWPTHGGLLERRDRHFFASNSSLGEGVSEKSTL